MHYTQRRTPWRRVGVAIGCALFFAVVAGTVIWRLDDGERASSGRARAGRIVLFPGADADPRTDARLSSAPRADGGNAAAIDRDAGRESPFLSTHIGDPRAASAQVNGELAGPSAPAPQPPHGDEQSTVDGAFAEGSIIRPQPTFVDGSFRGYRVYPGRDRAQFNRVGLRPGDLVLAVNGSQLDGSAKDVATLRGMGPGAAAMLTIERDGRVEYVFVD